MATPRAAQNGTFQRVSRSTREDVIGGSYDSTASNGRRAAARRTGGRPSRPVYVIYWSRLCYLLVPFMLSTFSRSFVTGQEES